MDSTLAKRQQQWRERQEAEGKKQLVAMVSNEAHQVIERIRLATGEKKADVVERAILALEKPADLFSLAEEADSPNLDRVQTVSLIQELREKDQLSYQVIADKLNGRKVPTFTGTGKWHGKTVQKIYKNTAVTNNV